MLNERQSEPTAIGIFSRGIWRIPHLGSFLTGPLVLNPASRDSRIQAAVGWGRKPSGERAARYAAARGLPCLRMEDGFLRSVGLGVQGAAPLSLVVDDLGIYFDGTRPSRLEEQLNDAVLSAGLLLRAEKLLESLKTYNLSKYNHGPDAASDALGDHGRPRVLLVDQTANDQSIRWGLASADSFATMFEAARAENPGAELCIKTHPEVIAGKKGSALAFARDYRGVTWIGEPVSPLSLLRQVDRVYTVSSQMGFEALMLDKPVSCFGLPFYAGWGATDDRVPCPRRLKRRSLLEILAVAYILYAQYRDPTTGEHCEVERVVEHLALQRRRFGDTQGRIYALGIGFWKRAYVRPFVASPWNTVRFVRSARQARALGFDRDTRIVVWASRETNELQSLAKAFAVPVWRMEDGFIRSIGLGSDFVRPWSLVLDRRGIYFDPSGESDLEYLLNEACFSRELIERAVRVRALISTHRITKYNVELDEPMDVIFQGRPVILVPGQVEDDASVVRGGLGTRTNEALLRAVREANPDAYLLFKPHPDVLARNRSGRSVLRACARLCDHIETRHSIVRCIEAADEVHTMTSLTGFDALLRGKRVTTYGAPFYAGWGLTQDHAVIARRHRRLTLDELVAGTLLLYPRYWDPDIGAYVELEDILHKMIVGKSRMAGDAANRPSGWRSWAGSKWFTYLHAVWLSSRR